MAENVNENKIAMWLQRTSAAVTFVTSMVIHMEHEEMCRDHVQMPGRICFDVIDDPTKADYEAWIYYEGGNTKVLCLTGLKKEIAYEQFINAVLNTDVPAMVESHHDELGLIAGEPPVNDANVLTLPLGDVDEDTEIFMFDPTKGGGSLS